MGRNTPLRGTGGQPYEGGFRVPCLAWWPGKIPAGSVCKELATSMDLLPTFAELAGVEPPQDRVIDGKDIWSLLAAKEGAKTPHENFFYYRTGQPARRALGQMEASPARQCARRTALGQSRIRQTGAFRPRSRHQRNHQPCRAASRHCERADCHLRRRPPDPRRPEPALGSQQRPAGWLDSVVCLRKEGLPGVRGFPGDAIPLLYPGTDAEAWDMAASAGWSETSSAALDVENRRQLKLAALPPNRFDAVGGVLHNTADDASGKKGKPLQSVEEFGDVELHIEYLLSEKSNSGVYLMGRYEVQMLDSYGKPDSELKHGDNGGIYQRWDESREPKGYEGTPPTSNASRPAGEWQSFDIVFRAPRFDQDGKKISDATFVSVHHNGVLVHESISCSGPTRGHAFDGEVARAPLTIQGDHGPVALRNIWIRPLD